MAGRLKGSVAVLRRVGQRHPLLIAVPLALLLLGISLHAAEVILEGIPHSQDEVVYLFQAKIFASGYLYLPSLPIRVRRFFDHEFIINNGKWYGKYSPGHPLALVPGMAIGLPSFANALAGATATILLFALAARFYSLRTAVLACLLFAVSPFSILMSASFLSHAIALLFTLLFFLTMMSAVVSTCPERRSRLASIAGLSVGAVFLTRPYNAIGLLLYTAVCLGGILASRKASGAHWLKMAICFMVPLSLLALAHLAYNWVLTGSPLVFPQQAYSPYDTIGFGTRGVEWGAEFGWDEAVKHVKDNYRALKKVLVAWPGFYMIVAGLLAFLGRRRWPSLFLFPYVPIQVAAYGIYFHGGIFYGPRYWYEATWVLLVLAAEGMVVAFTWAERLVRSRHVWKVYAFGLVVLLGFSLKHDAALLPRYKGYNWMTRLQLPELEKPALVFVQATDRWQAYGRYFILQSPLLEQNEVIYARDQALHNVWKYRPPLDNLLLAGYFPGRHLYRIVESPAAAGSPPGR